MTEDAEAKLLEEAVQTSYGKGGEQVCITEEAVRDRRPQRKP